MKPFVIALGIAAVLGVGFVVLWLSSGPSDVPSDQPQVSGALPIPRSAPTPRPHSDGGEEWRPHPDRAGFRQPSVP